MRPTDKIERLVKKNRYKASPDAYDKTLYSFMQAVDDYKKQKSTLTKPNTWSTVVRSRIAQVATVLIVLSAICLFILSDKGEFEQHETTGSEIAVISKTPAELVSLVSLNIVFRNGDMEAVEKQLDKAEREKKPKLKERLTIDQLICELDGC